MAHTLELQEVKDMKTDEVIYAVVFKTTSLEEAVKVNNSIVRKLKRK